MAPSGGCCVPHCLVSCFGGRCGRGGIFFLERRSRGFAGILVRRRGSSALAPRSLSRRAPFVAPVLVRTRSGARPLSVRSAQS